MDENDLITEQPGTAPALGDDTDDDAAFDAAIAPKLGDAADEPSIVTQPVAKPDKAQASMPATNPDKLTEKPAFAPYTVKANGKDVAIASEADQQKYVSMGIAFYEKSQALAEQRKSFDEQREVYAEFEEEIDRDPDLKQAVALLFHQPSLRQSFAQLVAQLQESGEINPHEVRARVLERELKQRQQYDDDQRQTLEQDQKVQHGRALKEQHLGEIAKDLGKPVDDAYYQAISQLVYQGRAGDLLAAHKLHLLESGEFERRIMERERTQLRQKQDRIRQVQTPRASGVHVAAGDDDADFDAAIAAKLR